VTSSRLRPSARLAVHRGSAVRKARAEAFYDIVRAAGVSPGAYNRMLRDNPRKLADLLERPRVTGESETPRRDKEMVCENCKRVILSEEILRAPHPHIPGETLLGCPECGEEDFTMLCEVPGCAGRVSGGTPTADGFKVLCGHHLRKKRARRRLLAGLRGELDEGLEQPDR